MDCACIKGHFDFFLYPINDKEWIYIDTSLWMEGERYAGDKVYNLNVKDITTKAEFEVQINGREGQIIESETSFLDGLYLFSVINCETSYYKYGVSLFYIQEVYDELVVNHMPEMTKEIQELDLRMKQLKLRINSFKTMQNEDELIYEYEQLIEYVEKLKCKL